MCGLESEAPEIEAASHTEREEQWHTSRFPGSGRQAAESQSQLHVQEKCIREIATLLVIARRTCSEWRVWRMQWQEHGSAAMLLPRSLACLEIGRRNAGRSAMSGRHDGEASED